MDAGLGECVSSCHGQLPGRFSPCAAGGQYASPPGATEHAGGPAADVTLGTERVIVLHGNYDSHDIQLATVTDPGAQATQIYGTTSHAQSFEYCQGLIKGAVLHFDSPIEAVERHKLAINLPVGDAVLPADLSPGTVGDYGARYFLDGGKPSIYFPIQDKGVVFAIDPLGRSQNSSLQASIAFANQIFELSGLKDTYPLRQIDLQSESNLPVDVKVVRVEPSLYGHVASGTPLTAKVTLSYNFDAVDELDIRNTSIVFSKTDGEDALNSLRAAASPVATTVAKGMGEVTIEVPVNLDGAVSGQRIRVGADFSIQTESGPQTHSIDRLVQYTIGAQRRTIP